MFDLAAMTVGVPKKFEVDFGDAGGKGNLNVVVTSPSGKPVELDEEILPMRQKLSFTPLEEGPYQIDAYYDDEQVCDCLVLTIENKPIQGLQSVSVILVHFSKL